MFGLVRGLLFCLVVRSAKTQQSERVAQLPKVYQPMKSGREYQPEKSDIIMLNIQKLSPATKNIEEILYIQRISITMRYVDSSQLLSMVNWSDLRMILNPISRILFSLKTVDGQVFQKQRSLKTKTIYCISKTQECWLSRQIICVYPRSRCAIAQPSPLGHSFARSAFSIPLRPQVARGLTAYVDMRSPRMIRLSEGVPFRVASRYP